MAPESKIIKELISADPIAAEDQTEIVVAVETEFVGEKREEIPGTGGRWRIKTFNLKPVGSKSKKRES